LKHLFARPADADAAATPRRIEAQLPDGRTVSLIHQQRLANWGMDQAMLTRTGLVIHDRPVHLLVGRARSELTASLVPLAMACAAGALLFPALAAAFLAALVPRALRPLRELGEAVARRDADSAEPVPVGHALEVQPIALRLNDLLLRIGAQRDRERRFLADTAHELRNPLAELHAMADVALLEEANDTSRHAETFADMKQVAQRLADLVDHLFRLARHARTATVPSAVCVPDMIDAALRELAPQAQARGLVWQCSGDAQLHVTADPVLLRALLQNLLGNVAAHARPESNVQVDWSGTGSPGIVVRNECSAAASASAQHLGHGLGIVRTYAYALRATIEAGRSGDTFEVRVGWPEPAGSSPRERVAAHSE
jgi:signal transduction histidine kinase